MADKVTDRYTVELEALPDHLSALPYRGVATNTDDNSSAETQLTLPGIRGLLLNAYGGDEATVEYWLQQLADHHYADLIAGNGDTREDRCVFNSAELLPFGFPKEELRPWKDVKR